MHQDHSRLKCLNHRHNSCSSFQDLVLLQPVNHGTKSSHDLHQMKSSSNMQLKLKTEAQIKAVHATSNTSVSKYILSPTYIYIYI